MYKEDLALNNLQRLIRHKTQPTNQTKSYIFNIHMYKDDLALNNQQRLIRYKTQQTNIEFTISLCIKHAFNHEGQLFASLIP